LRNHRFFRAEIPSMFTAAKRRWLAVAVCLLSPWTAAAQQEPNRADRSPPSSEQLALWIRELDADEFLSRENAMMQLLAAGRPALVALQSVLASGSLEATSRGLFVVRQLGLSQDDETQELAGKLLADLSAREETPLVARRAAAVLQELQQERAALAQAELLELGAQLTRSQVVGGFVFPEGLPSLQVGDSFRGTERDLKRLRWLTDVPLLIFSGKRVTDGWLQQAAAMPGLEELHLYATALTDAGLAPLREHPSLKQLGLYYTPVGNQVLESLQTLSQLQFIKLYGTRVTKERADEFAAAAGIKVDHRRGAFLGVSGKPLETTCRISRIQERSPAEKAGLLPDDEVIRFNQAIIKSFDRLTAEISKHEVGDEVEIEVIRRPPDQQGPASKVVVKVVLTPWEVEPAVQNIRQ
jgi:PDZ domain